MKANELIIGNYVNNMGVMIKFDEDDWDCIVLKAFSQNPMERYTPIPLTEDILLKCGFTFYKEENVWHTPHEFHIRVEDSELKQKNKVFWIYFDEQQDHPITCIFELHQLQNLYFALTGEELTIKL